MGTAIDLLPEGTEYGPAMTALDRHQWRHWVVVFVLEGVSAAEACRRVGYKGDDLQLAKQGYKLTSDPRIQAAIVELGRQFLSTLVADSVKTLRTVLNDPAAKNADRVKAAAVVLDRVMPQQHLVKHDHHHLVELDHTKATLEALRYMQSLKVPRDVLLEKFGTSGLGRYERMLELEDAKRDVKLIEAAPEEVA